MMKAMPLTDERIGELLSPYGIDSGPSLCAMVRQYTETLLRWNRTVSLTTVTHPEEIVRFHFGESFFGVRAAAINKGRLADIGTGAGFPGIPIRMASSDIDLTLVEPNTKKSVFVSEVVRQLGLSNVTVTHKRVEEAFDEDTKAFDFVTARALGSYKNLLRRSKPRLQPGGRLILWLGAEQTSLISSISDWRWHDPVQIPGSRARFLLCGTPVI